MSSVLIQRSILLLGAASILLCSLPPFVALLLGAACAWILNVPDWAQKASRPLLSWSIVALGFGVELPSVLQAGGEGLVVTAVTLAVTFAVGLLLGRWMRLPGDQTVLVAAGTAICGGSAIAALAPLLRAENRDVGMAFGVVFALNAVALLAFPILGESLGMGAEEFGLWCALAIHDTSSVVGAAGVFGPEALELATVTKLSRALWILPVGFLVAAFCKRKDGASSRGPRIPWFLIGFLAAALLMTLLPALRSAGDLVSGVAPKGMQLALFSIGLGLTRQVWASFSARTLGFAATLWVGLGLLSLVWILS